MLWQQQVEYASISDIGFRRRNNQDAFAVQICSDPENWSRRGHLFLVADGMGGHAVGELASKIAADTLPHTFFKSKQPDTATALKSAVESANSAIYERGSQNRDFERMGTTCTALVLGPQGAIIGHVGDSRVYRIRDGRIDQLTFDHSLQWELLRQGKLKPDEVFLHEPRHVITRSLGPEPAVQVDIEGPYVVLPGDRYLLCSDGLTGHLTDFEIGMIASELPPGEACKLLVNLANLRGGSDNITVVIIHVGDVPEGAELPLITGNPENDEGLSWPRLILFWTLAIMFVLGLCVALLDRPLVGGALIAASLIALAAQIINWYRNRPRHLMKGSLAETTLWRPYRSATAKFNRDFLNHLVALESDLQRTAGEEGWAIDWQKHEAAYKRAKAALGSQHYARALREYATTIDILMAGVHLQRKQMDRKAKWGKRNSPPPPEKSTTQKSTTEK